MNQIKMDNYKKSVLTVIAICLTILTLKQLDFLPKAYAGEPSINENKSFANYGLVPLNKDGSIDVNIKSSNETVTVNVEEVGGFWVGGSTLPVKVKD